MVFRQVIAVEPAPVGELQHFQAVLEYLVGCGLVPFDPVEQPEVQSIVKRTCLGHDLPPAPIWERPVSRIIRRELCQGKCF